jgi:hypothetical protein
VRREPCGRRNERLSAARRQHDQLRTIRRNRT